MTINIVHRGVELTEAIKQYVEEKIQSLEKYAGDLQHADVEVGMTNHHHQKGKIFLCKVVLQVPGQVIRIEREAEDLYKAIDKVRDHVREELSHRKERLGDKIPNE